MKGVYKIKYFINYFDNGSSITTDYTIPYEKVINNGYDDIVNLVNSFRNNAKDINIYIKLMNTYDKVRWINTKLIDHWKSTLLMNLTDDKYLRM
jgi:RNA-splicing ligase RtcB